MDFLKRVLISVLVLTLLTSGCFETPKVDGEKAGYLAGIRFLETHPGKIASYTVNDPGGDAFVVYFNITSNEGVKEGFAEYLVDRYEKEVYASSKYATLLALEQSSELTRVFKRYPAAKFEGDLIRDKKSDEKRYIWQIRVVTNGVEIAVFAFDAVNEELINENIKTYQTLNIQTA